MKIMKKVMSTNKILNSNITLLADILFEMGKKLFPWKFQPHSLSSALQHTFKNATVSFGDPRVYNPT